MNRHFILRWLMIVSLCLERAHATEYAVNKQGADTHSGTAGAAFLTIQRGVNALQPGDTLTIGPGEYRESVRRDKLGSAEADTVIRAEIPGTVLLRGDVPVSGFTKVPGSPLTYVADVATTGEVVVVNEADTLRILGRLPGCRELDFTPGQFYHDRAAGKVYVSTTDFRSADEHRYTATVIPTHGFYLSNARRVRIEGLAATGFNAVKEVSGKDLSLASVWGIFIANGRDCVIRDCQAYLNGQGIGLNSTAEGSGGNAIEQCMVWGNATQFGVGDRGGITLIDPRRDAVRDCTSFLNGEIGINIRGAPAGELSEKNQSRLERNLAWGNAVLDFKIKAGAACHHYADRCVGVGRWNFTGGEHSTHSLLGRREETCGRDSIQLFEEEGLDPLREFADPENHDYRLQATSRFRAALTNGADRGPFPYRADIFYVRADGDDGADGLSVGHAWRTLGRGVRGLRAGDTLYLQPGVYREDVDARLQGREGAPIAIRGRGRDPVVIQGRIRLADSRRVQFTQLNFGAEAALSGGGDLSFENCGFTGGGAAVSASRVAGLRLRHCAFTGFRTAAVEATDCSELWLSGNLYDNREGVAVRLLGATSVRYSDYNSYRPGRPAWETGDRTLTLAGLQNGLGHDAYSRSLKPEFVLADGAANLKNGPAFAAAGPVGRPVGPYRDERQPISLALVEKPKVHSVSATTANIEWMTSLPATCELVWGEPLGEVRTNRFDVDCFGTFSLTGLEPGRTYYFGVRSLRTPAELVDETGVSAVMTGAEPLVFATLSEDGAPAVYHVAPDGNDSNRGLERGAAWRTLQHAADRVAVGDTVLIAGGRYFERVRIRASGEAGAPIVFKALPGERVVMDGADKALNAFFIATGKQHLRFDGFYLVDSNRQNIQDGLFLRLGGEFKFYQCKDLEISRCFSDGRGGYTAAFITARETESLRIRNCVTLNKFHAEYFLRCPDLLVEHSVFARPMICSILVRNDTNEPAIMNHNIFTDNLKKKADLNISSMFVDYSMAAFRQSNNCYLVRSFPPNERYILNRNTIGQVGEYIHAPLFADPLFAGDPGSTNAAGFAPDRLMDPNLKVDFNSFFATHPEVVRRGIGLQREVFTDYRFGVR